MKKPTSITVNAKRWFQKSFGNTYHSVVVINDDTGEQLHEGFEYGYDRQYEETAANLISDAGWIGKREASPANSLHRWLESNGVALHINVEDVKRQKDL